MAIGLRELGLFAALGALAWALDTVVLPRRVTLTLAYAGVVSYGLWLALSVDPVWGIAVLVAFPPAIFYWHYFRHPRRASAVEQEQDRHDLAAAQARIQAAEASRRRAP